MLGVLRTATHRTGLRAFSTTPSRSGDLAKLVLIGNLVREPEPRMTKNDKEYVSYTVATNSYSLDANGERRHSATWHRILSFQENSNRYLQTLKKGSKVYVEAGFELREPEPDADPTTPHGQRQIFLKHESIRVLSVPRQEERHEERHEE